MNRFLKFILILFMLLPSMLWIKNAGTHRLGSSSLEADKSFYELMRRVSASSYPVIHDDSLFLVSVSDEYIYEYALRGTPEFIQRYEIGEKDKIILPYGDRILLGFQTNQIRNRLTEIKAFDLTQRKVTEVTDQHLVMGDIVNNIVVYDGWMYLWGMEEDRIRLTWTDGVRIKTSVLWHTVEEGDQLGFHLELPVENLPVFEIRGKELKAFLLTPDGATELAVQDDRYELPFIDGDHLQELIDLEQYSHYYLRPGELLARMDSASEEWENALTEWVKQDELIEETADELENIRVSRHATDVYELPEFTMTGTILDWVFLYPKDLAVTPGADSEDNDASVRAQERVVRYYQGLLEKNSEAMEEYMAEDQLRDFFFTPTSLMLILMQLLLIPVAKQIFKGRRARK